MKDQTTQPLTWPQAQYIIRGLQRERNWNTLLLFACGFYFGLRISDLLKLKWKDISGDRIVTQEKKTKKKRIININMEVQGIVRTVLSQIEKPDPEHFVFIYQRSDGNPLKHISVTAANKRIKKVFTSMAIEVANPSSHTLRKTFARRVWEKNGKTDEALINLMKILNHRSLVETKDYIGITAEVIKDIYMGI